MFREIVRRFSNKTTQKIMLGRWATIDSELNKNYNKSINFNIDSANHDHCGSELCTNKIKIKTKKNIIFKDEEMFPYII
tara:strand:+ start:161 stop:397 length:237 start_codon:yes stop_codon:yes gene_type:complete